MADVAPEVTPEELTPDEPPKRDRKRARNAKRPTTRAARAAASARRTGRESLAAPLQAFLEMGAQVWMIRDEECGGMLLEQAPAIADGMNVWAQSDPKVYRALSRWLEGGGAGALIIALWPLGSQVAEHHVVPAVDRFRERRAQAAAEAEWQAANPEVPFEAPGPAPAEVFEQQATRPA